MTDPAVVADLVPTGVLRITDHDRLRGGSSRRPRGIRQAVATAKNRTDAAVAFLREFVEEVKASGFVADALARSGQDATVAP